MSGSTLPNLPTAGTITGAELLYMVQNGGDTKVTSQALINAVLAAITPAFIGSLDLSTLPSSDPGNGHVWLNGGVNSGVLQVGS
jgi:hypothetical protein